MGWLLDDKTKRERKRERKKKEWKESKSKLKIWIDKKVPEFKTKSREHKKRMRDYEGTKNIMEERTRYKSERGVCA